MLESVFSFFEGIFGSKSEREIKNLWPIVEEINQTYETLHEKSDEDLVQRTQEFQSDLKKIEEEIVEDFQEELEYDELQEKIHDAQQPYLDNIMVEAFAMVKDTCRRLVGESWKVADQEIKWNMIPYDVQIIGGIILHQGKIAEMKTGEGKTLAATMPMYLNALTGRGVHLVTVNDYLARRDAEWMGKIYERLGLTVGSIQNEMNPLQRKDMYDRDITYGTNNEFGFDYLRDNMAIRKEDQVHRGYHYAIVDEVDSVLIDEARTPLIISGVVEQDDQDKFLEIRPMVERLVRQQTQLVNQLVAEAEKLLEAEDDYEAGIKVLQASRGMPKHKRLMKLHQQEGVKKLERQVENDYMRDKKMDEIDDDLFFSIDEKSNIIDLTEKGRQELAPDNPEMFVIPDLGEEISNLEEMEDLDPQEQNEKREEIHRKHSERSERIHNISQLLRAYTLFEKDVQYVVQDGKVLIVDEFTGRVMPGRRFSDGLHQALEAKERVKVERETQTLATITLQNYFRLYHKLAGMTGTAATEAGEFAEIYELDVTVIPTNEPVIRKDEEDQVYRTLREKYNAVIEDIVERHNKKQPVLVGTVSVEASEKLSRMLKRVGIPHNVLNAKQHQRESEIVSRAGHREAVTIATNMAGRGTDIKLGEGVTDIGGLHIIGTERHEARRIDLQLKGRSGRQGDPGSSQFYLSLEDDLMRLFGSERIANVMDRLGLEEGEVIQHRMITKSIERAQKKVEARNFGIRKHLLEYDDVMNQQREVIYSRRNAALRGDDLRKDIMEMLEDYVDSFLGKYTDSGYPEEWDWDAIRMELLSVLTIDLSLDSFDTFSLDLFKDKIISEAESVYTRKEEIIPEDLMRQIERFIYLRVIDDNWKDHLYEMDQIREGINLRAYGQKDPLIEYKKAGYEMFVELLDEINRTTLQTLYRTQISQEEEQRDGFRPKVKTHITSTVHEESSGMGFEGAPAPEAAGVGAGGQQQRQQPGGGKIEPRTVEDEPGRNDPCWCGSGKKYKKCHGR